MPRARVHVIPTSAPDDVSGLLELVEVGKIDPSCLVAILGKTEGNGCVNDFTRAFAVAALKQALGANAAEVALVMSGGTEGGLAPHLVTFEVLEEIGTGPSMAVGATITRDLSPSDIGTLTQVKCVAEAVRTAVRSAWIAENDDVHFVQVKCPLLTSDRIASSANDDYKRYVEVYGAFEVRRLRIALGLREIDIETAERALAEDDRSVWSGRASASAGSKLLGHEILVLGMSASWCGPL